MRTAFVREFPVFVGSAVVLLLVGCGQPGMGGPLHNVTEPSVYVSISGQDQVRIGSSVQFNATVANSTDPSITWQVNGVSGGSAVNGIISQTGLYTPPASLPSPASVSVIAFSQASPLASATLNLSILNPIPLITSVSATKTSNGLLLDVLGSDFAAAAEIQVAGASVTTNQVSTTELQASIVPPTGATTLSVAVANPNPGASVATSVNVSLASLNATIQTATRLLDQATFGPTLKDVQHVQSLGPEAYLAEQFSTPPTLIQPLTNPVPTSCVAVTPGSSECLNSQWWQGALTGNDQLRQRVAFALSQIFVVSYDSVNPLAVVAFQNVLLKDAFGNFSTLLHDITTSNAMGAYLNMLNSASAGTGQIANENFARESLQLFTIGLNQLNQDGTPQLDAAGNNIPTYTQAQVQSFARAYTGWTYANSTGASAAFFPASANYLLPMMPVDKEHDQAEKALLNGTVLPAGQTAEQDLKGALDNIFAHQNVGPFICRQLIQHLVSSNPSPAYISRIAAVFTDNGNGVRGDLQAVIHAILLDSEARAGNTEPTVDGGHLREPILYLANVMRALGAINTDVNGYYDTLSDYLIPLGEVPWVSPSVFNFFTPDYQLPGSTATSPEFEIENTATAMLRLSLADSLVHNSISGFAIDFSAASNLGQLAASPGNLVDSLGVIFMHGQMPAAMRTAIVNHITTLSSPAERARVATFLVITSSLYKVQH